MLLLFYRYRNPITTEKFLNPVEESEIEEPLDDASIIHLVRGETMMKIRMRKKIVMKKVSYLLFLLRKG